MGARLLPSGPAVPLRRKRTPTGRTLEGQAGPIVGSNDSPRLPSSRAGEVALAASANQCCRILAALLAVSAAAAGPPPGAPPSPAVRGLLARAASEPPEKA